MMSPFQPAHIRAWRQERGMTMVELAAKAGMDQGHLSKLERGLLQYTQQNLESLAAALGVTPAALLESEPSK